MSQWFYPRGSLQSGQWSAAVSDELAGWKHTGLHIGDNTAVTYVLPASNTERMIIPFEGTTMVQWNGADTGNADLNREHFFTQPADVLYLGSNTSATVKTTGRFAVASAFSDEDRPAQFIAAADVPLELRGAGQSSRQVHNFGVPGALDAQSLIVCEVVTPAGNWSSYPPHKHDQSLPGQESNLEEIYYFETQVRAGLSASEDSGFGLFHSYPSDERPISINEMVKSGDIALVPHGFHGPAVAAPEYDLYYLNVMAGPDPERAWLITDDSDYQWVRQTWDNQIIDSRLPLQGGTPQ